MREEVESEGGKDVIEIGKYFIFSDNLEEQVLVTSLFLFALRSFY